MKYRHLPHINTPDGYQFVTFRTYDSTDSFLRKLSQNKQPNKHKQMAIDEYLDASSVGAYLNGAALQAMKEAIELRHGELYELTAYCVMPNHVHLLVKQIRPLAEFMRLLKGSSAKTINNILLREGHFWAADYYDRGIRSEPHFWQVYEYIRNNPLKLGPVEAEDRFYGLYES